MLDTVLQRHISNRRRLGAVVDLTHPLMKDCVVALMVNELSGGTRNHAGKRAGGEFFAQTGWAANYWKMTEWGACVGGANVVSDPDARFSANDQTTGNFFSNQNFSMYCFASRVLDNGNNRKGGFFNYQRGLPDFAAQYFICINGNLGDTQKWYTGLGIGSSASYPVNLLSTQYLHSFGAVNNPNKSYAKLFLDGSIYASGAASSLPNINSTLVCGSTGDTNFYQNMLQYTYLIWKRALSDDEMAWLHHDPYAWVQEPYYRRYFIAASAAGPGTTVVGAINGPLISI